MRVKFYITLIITLQNLISYSQAPDWLWAKSAKEEKYDWATSVALDASSKIYLAGAYRGDTILFDSNALTNLDTSGETNDLFLAKYDATGNLLWLKKAGSIVEDNLYHIEVDISNNIYVAGTFSGDTVFFDSNTLLSSDSTPWNCDLFLTKYDINGNVLWAKSAGGMYNDIATSIAIDTSGNAYLTGGFNSRIINFDSITLSRFDSINIANDIFLTKYDINGNVLWAKSTGGIGIDEANSIAVDGSGYIYVAGDFSSDTLFFDSTILTNTNGYMALFLTKYDTDGNIIWAKSVESVSTASSVKVDASGNIYLTGKFYSDTLKFDNTILINCDTNFRTEIFLAKFDTNGNVLWAKSAGGMNNDYVNSLAIDISGNVYIAGWFTGDTIKFDSFILENSSLFLAKYDSNGNILWAKGANGLGLATSVAIDTSGFAYLAGYFQNNTIIFDTTTLSNTNSGFCDIFLAKLNNSITTGIDELSNSMDISIYPNPTDAVFTITFPPDTRQVQILNSLGQIIQQTIVDRQGNFSFMLSQSGLYFIKIMTDKLTVTKKLIVTN